MTASTTHGAFGAATSGRFGAGLAALSARFAARRRRAAAIGATRRELDALSDRELADIGIARCDIDRVARASAGQY